MRAGAVYLAEDRKSKGLPLEETIATNLMLAAVNKFQRGPLVDQAKESRALDEAIQRFDIRVGDQNLLGAQKSPAEAGSSPVRPPRSLPGQTQRSLSALLQGTAYVPPWRNCDREQSPRAAPSFSGRYEPSPVLNSQSGAGRSVNALPYEAAAVFSFDRARILTRTLAGLAAALIISPVAGLRTSVPARLAGTLRRPTFRRPGRTNSPTPRGWTEPRNRFSSVAYTPAAVFRGISFSSAMRLISADLVRVCLTGLIAGEAAFGAFLTAAFRATLAIRTFPSS